MATYQLTLYLFTTSDGAGWASGAVTGPVGAGERLILADRAGTLLSVDASGAALTVTEAQLNPVAWRGAVAHVAGRLSLRRDGGAAPGAEVAALLVGFGERSVGIASAAPLVPGAAYRVLTSSQAGPGDIAGILSTDIPARAGQMPAGFDRDCRIDTPDGPRQVATLVPGDLVTTLDNGSQPLRWIGVRVIPQAVLAAQADVLPVLFAPGALGNQRPLLVAPQHRLLLSDWRAQVYFGEDQVLIPACAMVNGDTIRQVLPTAGLICHQLLFDRHEVILAEGALAESLHPGEIAADDDLLREIESQLPGLAQGRHRAAYPVVRAAEARGLPPEA